jgi:ADP-heptose:LPS heptosyltransferase
LSKRKRWKPVRGYGSRVYEARERALLRLIDLPALILPGRRRAAIEAAPVDPLGVRRVLILRLDRIGDLIMSLPALAELRAALPEAHLTLAVGSWCASLARRAPVDEVLVWSAPWVGRRLEGGESLLSLVGKARALALKPPDLALDLQGDVRATLLMALTRARLRVGYANTGGGWLLTHAVPLDETVSWVDQNRMAARRALDLPPPSPATRPALVREEDRALGRRLLGERLNGLPRPLIGIHPSGGRPVKQWDLAAWRAVAERLAKAFGATLVVTGSVADRGLAAALLAGFSGPAADLTGCLDLDETLSVISVLDLFLSCDTGPMHMACALDTPSVSVFGPSDPLRYFSAPSADAGARHLVVRQDLWCAPCNLIRRPPSECSGPLPPECLRLVSSDEVSARAERLLRQAGYSPRSEA